MSTHISIFILLLLSSLQAHSQCLEPDLKGFDWKKIHLSELEKDVVRRHPYQGVMVLYWYSRGAKISAPDTDIFRGPNSAEHLGTKDAFRHTLINALSSSRGFESVALEMAIAHEQSSGPIFLSREDQERFHEETFNLYFKIPYSEYVKCNPVLDERILQNELHQLLMNRFFDHQMDLHNNGIGLRVGRENVCASIKNLSEKVAAEIEQGTPQIVLKSSLGSYLLAPSNTKLTSTYDPNTPSKILYPVLQNGKLHCSSTRPSTDPDFPQLHFLP